jgi:hypothetical protein
MGPNTKAYEEHSVVRFRVGKTDDKGRAVAAGATGTIVHVYPVPPTKEPAYVIEITLFDAQGVHNDSHLIDARHSELEVDEMRLMDSQAWTLLVEAAKKCPGLPENVRKVLALPLADLMSLPFIDGAKPRPEGQRCVPYWREHSFDASYLEFLDDQIRREPRGPEWSQRLRTRRDALAPFVNVLLLGYTIKWDDFRATIEVDARGQRIVHFELHREGEGG